MKKTAEDLNRIRENAKTVSGTRVVVGMATCGIAAGAVPVLDALSAEVEKRGLKDVRVSQAGCIGLCCMEPIVEIFEPGKQKITYVNMDREKAQRVADEHLAGGKVVAEYTLSPAVRHE